MATVNNNKKAKLPELVRNNPISASILSKLVKDNANISSNQTFSNIPQISMFTYEKLQSNEDITQLFPDVELCIQILTSCILAPNDMMSTKLTYLAPNLRLPTELKSSIMRKIEDYIEINYKFNNKLSTILRESLFTKGSYIEAIIPEASLDEVINNYNNNNKSYNILGLESYLNSQIQPTYQFIGQGYNKEVFNISQEDGYINIVEQPKQQTKTLAIAEEDLMISITDNPKVLSVNQALIKNAKLYSKLKTKKNNLTIGNEDDANSISVLNKFFRDSGEYQNQDFIYIPNKEESKRESIGAPLVLKLSTESVIPVHIINDTSKHLGYFVLLDNNGCPINAEYYQNMDMDTTYDMTNVDVNARFSLIKKAREALYGITKNDVKLENIESLYSQLVETMIKKKLESGAFSNLVDIKQSADIFRVMFSRALKAKQTKLLFLPADLVAFYAFDYRDNGTGKSLMEKTTVLYSLRAIMLFSRMLAYIKNSTNRTVVNTTLDENDTDQEGRMEQIMSEVLKLRQSQFPLGITNLNDLVSWVQHLGLSFKFQGPGLPNTDISVEDNAVSKIMPDEELDNKIKEYIFMAFGLTPEIVESGYSSEFASTFVAKNLLLAKRVTRIQEKFTEMVTEHIQKLIQNDMTLIEELRTIIINNKKELYKSINKNKESAEDINKLKKSELVDYIVNVFISEIKVELPKPEMSEAQAIKQSFDYYKESIDSMADIVFNTEAVTDEYFGNLAGKIDGVKNIFKASLLLNWMNKNNYMPDLTDFLTKDDDGKPIFDALNNYKSFIDSLGESLLPFMKSSLKDKSKLDEKMQKIEDGANSSSDDYNSDDTTDEGETETPEDENQEGGDDDISSNDDNSDNDNPDNTGGGEGDNLDNDKEGDDGLDMDMDMDMDGDSDSSSDTGTSSDNKSTRSEKEIELSEKLLNVRLEKEKALAQKAAANAMEAKQKIGLNPSVDLKLEIKDNNKDDENNDGEESPELEEENNNQKDEEKSIDSSDDEEKVNKEDVLEPVKLNQYQSDINVFNSW